MFRLPPENHLDATMTTSANVVDGEDVFMQFATVIKQPTDGSCLFHSFAYHATTQFNGGTEPSTVHSLRRDLSLYTLNYQDDAALPNSDVTIREMVMGDAMLRSRVGYSTLDEYVERMAVDLDGQRVWGGIVEMIAFARSMNVNVHVWIENGGRYQLYTRVESMLPTAPTLNLLYNGMVHYDVLIPGGIVESNVLNNEVRNEDPTQTTMMIVPATRQCVSRQEKSRNDGRLVNTFVILRRSSKAQNKCFKKHQRRYYVEIKPKLEEKLGHRSPSTEILTMLYYVPLQCL